jgi:hypothetical protein
MILSRSCMSERRQISPPASPPRHIDARPRQPPCVSGVREIAGDPTAVGGLEAVTSAMTA